MSNVIMQILMLIKRLCVLIFSGIYWVDNKATELQMKHHNCDAHEYDEAEQDEDGPPVDPSQVDVNLQQVYFGQVVIPCPQCAYETEEVGMGIATIESEYDEDDDSIERNMGLPNMIQVGVVLYPCGHSTHSPMMTDRVVGILNARDTGTLKPEMIMNLTTGAED